MSFALRNIDSDSYNLLLASGLVLIPTAAYYLTHKLKQTWKKSKAADFDNKVAKIRDAIDRSGENSDSIYLLKRLSSQTMSKDGTDVKIEVNLVDNLKKKREIGKKAAASKKKINPLLHPEEGLKISDIGNDHRVIFSKFPVQKDHVLVITKKFENQFSILTQRDFEATYLTQSALKGLVIFNSGPESGHSQHHKHLQVVPMNDEFNMPVTHEITKESNQSAQRGEDCFVFSGYKNFKHLVVNLRPIDSENEDAEAYSAYLKQKYDFLMASLNNTDLKDSYNIVWTEKWMMVVIRKCGKAFGKYKVNGFGFAGYTYVKTPDELEDFGSRNPIDVLKELCKPNLQDEDFN